MEFEVASIHLGEPGKFVPPTFGLNVDDGAIPPGGNFKADFPLPVYIEFAYKLLLSPEQREVMLAHQPDWVSTQAFVIEAKAPTANATKDQMRLMLQALLADRFKLTVHHEQKEQSILALVVGKGGPKLKPSPVEDKPADTAPDNRPGPPVQISGNPQTGMTVRGAGQAGATRIQMSPDGTIHLEAERLTMAQLADSLTRFAGRPVVDMTGLSGPYVVALDLSRDDLMNAARAAGVNIPPGAGAGAGGAAGGGPADPSGTSVLQSVEQLGLKLDSRKAPMDYLVIDHLEKTPTDD